MRQVYSLLLVIILLLPAKPAYSQCGSGRYFDKVFTELTFTPNIDYGGLRKNLESGYTRLLLDLYEPKNDPEPLRPLAILIHGGAFLDLPFIDKRSPDILNMAQDLVQRGYVVASPEYRLVKNPLALLFVEFMAREVVVSLLDANDAICYFVNSYYNGNPHRIDINRMFVGGVSAGALISLHGLFVDRMDELGEPYTSAAQFVEQLDQRDIQAALDNKYCGANILGGVSISGALIDTIIIKPKETAVFFSHGTEDNIVPHNIARPFGIVTLPYMYGPGVIAEQMIRQGMRVEFESWEGAWHVPFLAFDWLKLLELDIDGFLIDRVKFDSTMNNIARFFQELMGCPTPVRDHTTSSLSIYPNPSNGGVQITIPSALHQQTLLVQVVNTLGQTIASSTHSSSSSIKLEALPKGNYILRVQAIGTAENTIYTGKVVVN